MGPQNILFLCFYAVETLTSQQLILLGFTFGIESFIITACAWCKLPFDIVDNKLLFDKNSNFDKIISPQPTLSNNNCNYHSLGDINHGCVLYCDYHGIDFDSDFYKQNKSKLEISKPLILPEDIADIIIFLPSLLVLIIIYFLLPKRKKIQTAK